MVGGERRTAGRSSDSLGSGQARSDRTPDASDRRADGSVICDGGYDSHFFEQVVREVGVGVGVYGADGRFTYVNDAYCELLGRDVEDVLGSPLWTVNPQFDPEMFDQYWESFDINETRHAETVHVRGDGTEVPVETYTTAIETDGRRYHVGTISDISQRVESYSELERQNQRLEQFASLVSHDLRNPLNVAMGRLRIIQEECESEHFEAVETSLERMEDLIEDVLSLAREGSRIDETQPVSLLEAISTAWRTAGAKTATLEVADDLGVVRSDESRLCALFENLFRNALDHVGPSVTVRVGPIDDEGFYVEDDGPGIDPEHREKVFEYGYSMTDRGTGFGLAIVQQIAQAHGWDVELVTGSDGGARFEFRGVGVE